MWPAQQICLHRTRCDYHQIHLTLRALSDFEYNSSGPAHEEGGIWNRDIKSSRTIHHDQYQYSLYQLIGIP